VSRPAPRERSGVRLGGILLGIVVSAVGALLLAALGGGVSLLLWLTGAIGWEQTALVTDLLSALGLAVGAGVGTLVLLRASGLRPVAAAAVAALAAAAIPGFGGVVEQLAGEPAATWRQPLLLLAGAALGAGAVLRMAGRSS
jgi:hypothetical protein